MKVDLKGMSRKELQKLRADVDKALEKVTEKEMKDARDAMAKAAASYGFAPEDLMNVPAPKKRGPKAGAKRGAGTPKYRNPNNPGDTWTGKGRPPKWFTEAVNGGASRESMAI